MNEEQRSDLNFLFNPRSIAIVGSLRAGFFGGATMIENLQNFGFSGEIYPVNPSYNEVLGLKVYPSINEVPEAVDLVTINTPAKAVPAIIKGCVERGVKGAVIGSDGFAERDEEGAKLQREIVNIAKPAGLRLLGPNTVGVVDTSTGLVTSPYECGYKGIRKGSIALGAQTGLISSQGFPFGDVQYGISKICDFGNKCDIDESDYLSYLKNDSDTKVVSLYLEDVKDGQRFLNVAKEVTVKKPVLVYKAGRTNASRDAVASHTGSLSGEYRTYDSAFKQAGIIPLNTFSEIFEIPRIFASQPSPKGNRIAMVTVTGAGGIVAADTANEVGLSLAQLSSETSEKLTRIHPSLKGNPVDLGPAMVGTDLFSLYKEIIKLILDDENVDGLIVVLYVIPRLTPENYAAMFSELDFIKPVSIWVYGTIVSDIEETSRLLEKLGFPAFSQPETAIKAMGAMCTYNKWLTRSE